MKQQPLDKFTRTVEAGRREITSLRQDGYILENKWEEPNHVRAYVLYNPKNYRRLTVIVQPLWGLVLIKQGYKILTQRVLA